MLPGSNGEDYIERIIIDTAQATPSAKELEVQVKAVTVAIRDMINAGFEFSTLSKSLFVGGNLQGVVPSVEAVDAAFVKMGEMVNNAGGDMSQAALIAQALRARIDELKISIQELATQNNLSLADAARGIAGAVASPTDKRLTGVALSEIDQENAARVRAEQATSQQIVMLNADADKAIAAEHKVQLVAQTASDKEYVANRRQYAKEITAENNQNTMLQTAETKAAAAEQAAVIKAAIDADIANISRATAALREMAAAQRTTPLSASTSPQYAQLGFEPATTTAALNNLGGAFDKTAGKKDSFRLNLSQLYAKFKEGTLSVNDFSSVLMGSLGAALGFMVVSFVFQAVAAVGQLVTSLNQAAVASLAFLDSQFKLEVGLRDAQRQGFAVSRAELNKYMIDLNAMYPMISFTAMTKGIADSIFILKNFGLTANQAFTLFSDAATLSIATGKDMGDVTREMALAMSSGYSVALQKMGLDINKVTVAERAHAAGITESYAAMDRSTKAKYTAILIDEQMVAVKADMIEKEKTLAGQVEVTTAKIADQQRILGTNWLYTKNIFDQFGLSVMTSLANILLWGNEVGAYFEVLDGFLAKIMLDPSLLFDKDKMNAVIDDLITSVGKAHGLIAAFQGDLASQKSSNDLASALGIDPANIQTVYDSMDKFASTVLDDTLAYQKSLKDATQKYNDDLVKIDQAGDKKRLDLQTKLAKDLADIGTKLSQDIAKAQVDYARTETDANAKAAEDRVNSLIDEKRKEADIQQKYVEDVKKLQDKLTYDLEEAVRAGDVIQIRKLKRQYPTDLTALGTTRNQDLAQAQKDLQQKLSDAQRQQAFDKQQRAIDFQLKIVDLNAQAVLQRQQTQDQYVQSLIDLNQSLKDERQARVDAYNQQWRDMYQAYQDKLKLASQALADEINMNGKAMDLIVQKLISVYGNGGIFQQIFDGLKSYIESGGQAGLWKGLVAPAAPITGVSGVTGAGSFSGSGTSSLNQVQVSIDLGPDLVAKVVNTSLNVVADLLQRNA